MFKQLLFVLGLVISVPSTLAAAETVLQSTRDVLITGESARDFIGSPSAQDPHGLAACDLNDDGTGDLAVGAPRYGGDGRVYVVFGGDAMQDSYDLLTDADFTVTGSDASNNISGSLACGDLNGDSVGDLVIGAPHAGSYDGRVYIIYGVSTLSGDLDLEVTSADVEITGSEGQLGRDVAVADVNNDGVGDLVIGAPDADGDPLGGGPRPYAGVVSIVYGGPSLPALIDLDATPADVRIYGNNENGSESRIGHRLTTGDFNGDGKDDVAFGYYHAEVLGWSSPGYSGVFWGLLGDEALDAEYDLFQGEFDFKVYGSPSVYGMGESLATGDLNGDGYDELILLASDGNPSSVNVVSGRADMAGLSGDIQSLRSQVISFNVNQGYGALAAGDIDLDGRADLLIGNPFASPNAVMWAGEAYLFMGQETLEEVLDADADGDLIIQSEDEGAYLGLQLAVADLDGDDTPDLIVGSPQAHAPGRSSAGKVFLFFGARVQMILGRVLVPLTGPLGVGLLMALIAGTGVFLRARRS